MPQAQTGSKKSMPKVVRLNADDNKAAFYKNLGNGRRIPVFWATTVTLASGTTEIEVASGVEFSEFKVSDAKIAITAISDTTVSGAYDTTLLGKVYAERDTTNNIVKLKSTTAGSKDTDWCVYIFLADDATISSTDSNQIWS